MGGIKEQHIVFNSFDKYVQGNRLYSANGIGCTIVSKGGGIAGTGGGVYLTEL